MKEIIRSILLIFSALRLIPHWILFNLYIRGVIYYDVKRWLAVRKLEGKYTIQIGFLYLMTFYPEFRNIFYYRIGYIGRIIKYLCKPITTLYIDAKAIGSGLVIYHGFSTVIVAKTIGKDLTVYQQVTIGSYGGGSKRPTIGDNVTVYAGAKVFGEITLKNDITIGANAVVAKNVPNNCTVVGVPAYIVRKNGIKTREEL